MAYRKSAPKKAVRRSSGSFRKGSSSGGASRKRAVSRSGTGSAGARGGVHTVRIVIEQPGSSKISRPHEGNNQSVTPRKSPF